MQPEENQHPMNKYLHKVAVVTGAASEIGRSLSIQLAERGAHIAICDVDEAGLAETARLCALRHNRIRSTVVNVADRPAVHAFAEAVAAEFGTVNYLFNNAGVAFTGTIERSDYKDIERVIDVGFWGVVNGTKSFLPHLIASGAGHAEIARCREMADKPFGVSECFGGGLGQCGEKTESAGVGHRGDELRGTHAGHGPAHHGVLDVEGFSEVSAEHGARPPGV